MKIIILAGGSGKRLWPISDNNLPKQFLKFLDHESLFQKTCLRFENFKYLDEILIVINKNFEKITKEQLSEINFNKKNTILIEPYQKNTAGAILYSLKYLKEKKILNENEKILVLPSDHLIFPKDKFLSYLEHLNDLKIKDIVVFGIRPNKIETGYGYIKLADKIDENLYKVDSFIEKPTFEKAKRFFISEKYLWNAGIFLFTAKIFEKELKKHSSELFKYYQLPFDEFHKKFNELPNISIDYALLEKTKNILVNPLDVSWSDVGSWDSLYEVMEKDHNCNVTKGNVLTLDTKNSLIFAKKKLISTIGLDNILIVETENAIFLAKKGQSQKVKKLIEKLQKKVLK
jgi:mannose-1-phosphate guanylyltransferase / mannose-6-phosphate isomerase